MHETGPPVKSGLPPAGASGTVGSRPASCRPGDEARGTHDVPRAFFVEGATKRGQTGEHPSHETRRGIASQAPMAPMPNVKKSIRFAFAAPFTLR